MEKFLFIFNQISFKVHQLREKWEGDILSNMICFDMIMEDC